MIRVFSPSTVPHPWRQTWAIVALMVHVYFGMCVIVTYVLPWVNAMIGSSGWSFLPAGA